ncbi:hypothetical protein D3C81_1516980 [compost metagenome]
MRLGSTALDQLTQVLGVRAVVGTVAQHLSRGAEQGHAEQLRQGLLQFAQHGLQLFIGLRLFDDR